MACQSLASAQSKMKNTYDQKSVLRKFQPGDKVLVLLPVGGSGLQAKFSGPYFVEHQLSDTDYVINTPDQRRKSQVCHVNMLKCHSSRTDNRSTPITPAAMVAVPHLISEEDELNGRQGSVPCARLRNSEILSKLDKFLSHLSEPAHRDVVRLIHSYPDLFGDNPTQTHILHHDIDVGEHSPIKQHAYRVNPTK